MMLGLISAFFGSFLKTLLIIRYQHLHEHLSNDHDLSSPQKVHQNAVPRIGGLSILVGLICALLVLLLQKNNFPNFVIIFLLCSIPTFAIGFAEDLTKRVGVKLRLIFTAFSAALITYVIAFPITHLEIPMVDFLFAIPFFGFIFTVFAITGLANAYNIIDGFNGLASMVAVITLISITYVCFKVGDYELIPICLIMIGSILGFFIWNYPRGLIFLGDGGAYLIGFWIASISILLVSRHAEISPWFALMVNAYPIMETLFTIYRRRIHQNKNPGLPDGIHFHTLIYRRLLKKRSQEEAFLSNARTAPYLWVLTGLSTIPALLWWNQTKMLTIASLLFIISYVWIYRRIVQFKSPSWLQL